MNDCVWVWADVRSMEGARQGTGPMCREEGLYLELPDLLIKLQLGLQEFRGLVGELDALQ